MKYQAFPIPAVVFNIAVSLLMVLSFSSVLQAQVDFDECGVFDTDFSGCVLFFPDGSLFSGVQVDIQNPPMNQTVRVAGTSFSCGGVCFPDLCLSGAQVFFDCQGSPAPETDCDNGQDDDADGLTDCCDPDCACAPSFEICDNGWDDDCDGFVDLQDPDCSGAPPGGVFIRGDSNADGAVNVADALKTLGYLFLAESVDCLDAADVGDDGNVNIADAVALLSTLFSSAGPPALPYPDCGFDPTSDALDCWFHFVCP